jgi:tetratricopeptide (TPR) repeat protein
MDSAASLGAAGLALVLLVVVLAARRLVIGARAGSEPARSVAFAASLTGAFVALQFHYVTMDTGAILAMVLAGVISTRDPAEQRVSETAVAAARWSALAVGCVYALVACILIALVAADATSFAATRRILGGAAWEQASGDFARVRRLAPWEPRLARSEGEAATAVVLRGYDASAYRDGLAAFDRAGRMHPGDPVVAAERANLILNAGIVARDKAMLAEAERAFAAAEGMDPSSGVIKVGRATALLSLGETDQAIRWFESGLELSPNYRSGWTNLALAYERTGNTAAAEDARRRARAPAP